MTLSFKGPEKRRETFGLTYASDSHCRDSNGVTTCTFRLQLSTGSYSANVALFDHPPVNGRIPATAKLLSIAKQVPFTVRSGKVNRLKFKSAGVVASLAISGIPAASAGAAFATPQSFTVTAKDADGYTIVGTYSTPVMLTDSDTLGATSIATSGADGPPAKTLLSSSDAATLSYTGRGIPPATIAAAATGATGGSALFSPAGVIIVTLATDATPGTNPGECPAGTSGDLRDAICNAGAGNWIIFDCGDPCTIILAAPLPPIVQNQTIDGGSFGRVVVDGAGKYRAFFIDTGTVTLTNLQIQNAIAQGGNGGGIASIFGGGGGAGLGAGLFVNQSSAIATVENVYFLDDAVKGGNGGPGSGAQVEPGGGGGGGLGGNGGTDGSGLTPTSGAGGGGVLAAGADTAGISLNGANGGLGGGGGGGGCCIPCAPGGTGTGGMGGAFYATLNNGAGSSGASCSTGNGGAGGFGGGGGGASTFGVGGAGGFGGGGGGADPTGGNGGPGGGGGGSYDGAGGQGGLLSSSVHGGNGVTNVFGNGGSLAGGGGGAAAGPAIFVNAGALKATNSGASGSSASDGAGGSQGGAPGTADATPVFNYAGTVNGSPTTGPVASALSGSVPSLPRHRAIRKKRTPSR